MDLNSIDWLGHASFVIRDDGKNYYIDPYELKGNPPPANIIFVTHAHYDHWSPKDIEKIITPGTKIVCVKGCGGIDIGDRMIVTKPYEMFIIDEVNVKTVPAYNTDPAKQQFHPRSNEWVGYILQIGGMRIYHAGDTDFIPEMNDLGDVDVAMLPMGGTYTMNPDEMIKAANAIKAWVTIPMHYKKLLKNPNEAEEKVKSGVQGRVEFFQEIQF